MPATRRAFIKQLACLTTSAAALTIDKVMAEWNSQAFASGNFAERYADVVQQQRVIDSPAILLQLPAIAENGAVVPISVQSDLDNIDRLYIFVEKNPTPLAAEFEFSSDVALYVSARIKMAESSNVVVLARQGQQWLRNQQAVKVMVGGCGTG